MNMIELAREIGRQIQKDESYLKLQLAQQHSDEDAELQKLIGEFNLIRIDINNEANKEDRNDERIRTLNKNLRHTYAEIMKNENMTAYNNAKTELDSKINRVLAIIQQSAQGDDPDTTDYNTDCTGNCSTCGGCH